MRERGECYICSNDIIIIVSMVVNSCEHLAQAQPHRVAGMAVDSVLFESYWCYFKERIMSPGMFLIQ